MFPRHMTCLTLLEVKRRREGPRRHSHVGGWVDGLLMNAKRVGMAKLLNFAYILWWARNEDVVAVHRSPLVTYLLKHG